MRLCIHWHYNWITLCDTFLGQEDLFVNKQLDIILIGVNQDIGERWTEMMYILKRDLPIKGVEYIEYIH